MSELEKNCSSDCSTCGSSCEPEEQASVTLTLDDGTVVECAILTIYPVADKQYIALLPLNEEGENEEGEVFLYRFEEVDGEPTLTNIEDDDEYEAAADAFDEYLDNAEFDDMES